MKRIGILTAGGDTPALNATIHGAVVRANQLKLEIYGLWPPAATVAFPHNATTAAARTRIELSQAWLGENWSPLKTTSL
jgi:hypothetical protein